MVTLQITQMSKSFPGTCALDSVSFDVQSGQTHALVGGNGSGKSTLVKILAGVYLADGGEVSRNSKTYSCQAMTPTTAWSLGLRFVHQNPAVFPSLTVAENIALGRGFPTRFARIRRRELHRRTQTLLDRYEIRNRPTTLVSDLRPADRTMVAVARALADDQDRDDLLLVLDEPTASLPAHEVDILLAALRSCEAAGQGIIYVSHRIDEVLSLASTVTVLRDGRVAVTVPTASLTEESLVEHIAGRPIERLFTRAKRMQDPVVALRVEALRGGPLKDVSFVAHKREIVGIAGLLGSGRTELFRMLFGALPCDGGRVELEGRRYVPQSPHAAMAAGLAYVPEDRHEDAVFGVLSVKENLSAARLDEYWRGAHFGNRSERRDARQAMTDFTIRARSEDQLLSQLSGGNQQKVVIARWLARKPRLLLLDEPTQGVDVGARADIYETIRNAVTGGATALIVSSDFEELAHVCDRIIVLHRGSVAAELKHRSELNASLITEYVYSGGSKGKR